MRGSPRDHYESEPAIISGQFTLRILAHKDRVEDVFESLCLAIAKSAFGDADENLFQIELVWR